MPGHVSLKLYDVLGNDVAVLVDEQQDAGEHQKIYDSSELPAGMYFYNFSIHGITKNSKILLKI